MECKYCKKVLSSKSALNAHQKRTKYCLLIQGKSIKGEYTCNVCDKNFLRNEVYINHCQRGNCSKRLNDKLRRLERDLEHNREELQVTRRKNDVIQKEIAILRSQNSMLKDQLEKRREDHNKLATTAVNRPTTSNKTIQINNYLKKMKPLTLQDIENSVPLLTLEQHAKGAEGYAEFALEFPFKDKIVCVDVSRNKIKYKNAEGDIVEDIGFRKMMMKLCNALKDRSFNLGLEHRQKLSERWTEKELDSYDFMEAVKAISKYASGRESEFCRKVIKLISKGSSSTS